MTIVAGIDVGSTYTKAVLLNDGGKILGRVMKKTGFRLADVAAECLAECRQQAGIGEDKVAYTVSTGYGRHQVAERDIQATELTAAARGSLVIYPESRTLLDIGGQTMKASRVDELAKVRSFRLNDKCAAGTGAFLEKTARYMGYETEEIGALLATSKDSVPISGVCAVFAESEVINHLSIGTPPADIMQGAIESLVSRAVQLLKRVRAEPELTIIGGIARFPSLVSEVTEKMKMKVNVPPDDDVMFVAAHGAAILGQRRLIRIASQPASSNLEVSASV